MSHLLALIGAEYLILWYAATRNKHWLHSVAAINMILLPLLAGKLMTIGGFTSNITNVFYATVCTSQLLSDEREGRDVALFTITRIFLTMCVAVGLTEIVASFPTVAGNEAVSDADSLIGGLSMRILVASFLAFLTAQVALLKVFEWFDAWPLAVRYLMAAIACQVVDSALFFPIAFAGTGVAITEAATVGAILKIAVMLLFFPLMVLKPKEVEH